MHTEQVKKTRGRPKKDVLENRNCVAHTNLTVAEKWALRAAAEAANMTESDYIRSKII